MIFIILALGLIACENRNIQESEKSDGDAVKVGIITFLSGPAAGPFGIPAKQAAETLEMAINEGNQIPGYKTRGFGGKKVDFVFVDEAGGATKAVENYRNLVIRQNVDLVIGVISSGDCLALAPIAEELKTLTVLFDEMIKL